jgi:hypothetical protein
MVCPNLRKEIKRLRGLYAKGQEGRMERGRTGEKKFVG